MDDPLYLQKQDVLTGSRSVIDKEFKVQYCKTKGQ